MLDLHKLDIFLHVAEEGSFSKAAGQLHMSQPAVSQHILALEQQLGAALFERSRQGVALTPAGQSLRSYAERILRLVGEAELAVTDVHNLASGQIAVGATPGVSAYLLPEWVQGYRERFPNLSVSLHTGITPDIVGGILGRALALGVIEGELDGGDRRLGVAPLEEIDQLVVVGPRHTWWQRAAIPLDELGGQPIVMRQAGSQTRIWLDQELRAAGVQPRVVAELDNIESIKRIVTGGAAVTVLPAYAVRDEVAHGQLRTVAIDGAPLRRTLKLLWNRAAPLAPVAASFVRHLATFYPALAAARVVRGAS